MTKNKFDIFFSAPDSLYSSFFEDSQEPIAYKNLKLTIERSQPQPYASLEWAIPGLIVAYIAKPYFEGFLQEAGKEHYQVVKGWLKNLLRKAKTLSAAILVSGKNKFDETYSQSTIISIHFEIKSGRQIKLLFNNELSIERWEAAIDKFSILIEDNYKNHPNDNLSKMIENVRPENFYTVYGLINTTTNEWEFYDDLMLIEIQIKTKKDD